MASSSHLDLQRARRALTHPLWIGALALLIINDHFLKGSGRLPGVLTGKLSDFAGLLVAPALLAALLRLKTPRAWMLAHLSTGAVFAAIKLFPAAAHSFEFLTSLTPFPWRITVDPSDLMALPALLLSYRVFFGSEAKPLRAMPVTERVLAMTGAVACMATSPPEPGPCAGDVDICGGGGGTAFENASLVLSNRTDAQRVVRVRPLKNSVMADCVTMLADPTATLSREVFAPSQTWVLEPGRAVPLQVTGNCVAYLVDADGMTPKLLAWSAMQFPTSQLATTINGETPERTIQMNLDPLLGSLGLSEHPAVFDAPPLEPAGPSAMCAVPDALTGNEWANGVSGGGEIKSIESSPDGCHALRVNTASGEENLYVCVPEGAMPFQVGEAVVVNTVTVPAGQNYGETMGVGSSGFGLSVKGAAFELLMMKGNVLAHHNMALNAKLGTEPTVEASARAGCTGSHTECGELMIPMDFSFLGDHVGGVKTGAAGSKIDFTDNYGTLYITRAEKMPIVDSACTVDIVGGARIESVLLVPIVP